MDIYTTEDGKQVMEGDLVYNYYDMQPGRIGEPDCFGNGWFFFHQANGKRTILNGSRICTMELAEARGWVSKGGLL
jgi:hypothetical protein